MYFPGSEKIEISQFLELAETIPVIDVRSPSEYYIGHIPGSLNIPLFNDEERKAVGTTYKREGRFNAILKGLELTGSSMKQKLQEAHQAATGKKLLLHCWRGGMRSEAMAWLFSLGDIRTGVLEGGYKSYRHLVLSSLSEKRKTIVLGGMTGSSKTHILRKIKELNHQVIDLEAIANHKGSAFGSLGQPPQPSSEHFANLLFDQWRKSDPGMPLWLEDESRNIGSVFMPDDFYNNMQESHAIILVLDRKKRIPRLVEEYSKYPPEVLNNAVLKIRKRLGGEKAADSLKAIEAGDFEKAIDIILTYYDKAYQFGISKKQSSKLIYVDAGTDDIEENTGKVIKAAEKIIW